MYQQLLSEFDDQSLIITVNQRLCAHLLLEYAENQSSTVFPTPTITALNPWLKQQYLGPKRLLEPQQVHWLWQQVIEKSEHTDFILPTTQISHLVNEAYAQMHGWQVPWEELEQSDDKDHQTFLNWVREFDALLAEHNAITSAQLPAELMKHLDATTVAKKIYLVGFQDMPPALQALLKNATHIETPSVSQSVVRTQASNNLAELTAMANWAKDLLEKAPNKHIKIGCVVPDLQALRRQTTEIFYRSFQQAHSPMTPAAIYPFNISAGLSLLEYPMLRDGYEALLLLSENAIPTDKLRHVLASPYIFPLDEGMTQAAEFDLKIRDLQLTTWPLPLLLQSLKKYPDLQRAADFLAITPAPLQFPSEWAQSFIQQLETIGWPGSQSLSSEEYQLLGQWNSQLQALSRLDDFSGPVSLQSCLSHLHHLLGSASFQPQTDHSNAPIQVLGMLEAAGLPYDHLWIMGLDDSAWPPAAQSNPFIPQHLQQQYKLPHNSGEHELDYSIKLQASLIAHAKQSILSSPAQDNNSNKQPSALITAFPHEAVITSCDDTLVANPLENFSQDYAPTLAAGKKLKGGTAIASNQAACPFRAFAMHRLGAKAPREVMFGVSPILHGTLLHETLERIWRQLKSQQALLALTQVEQLTLITTHTDAVMTKKTGIPTRFYALEKDRLIQQINDWLNSERERPPFTVVGIEKSETIRFNGHEMSVRMDRVDQLADKSLVILDYKTSRLANPIKWLASPPLESQLPFYASFSQYSPQITGCSYAVINRDGCELKGYTDSEYTEHIDSWRRQLNDLMDAFIGGYAAVAPNPVARPCDHCELSALCRIEECEA